MLQLDRRRLLLGVTGSIAAYKAAELVRLLRAAGAEVQLVMTEAASQFITPMTLQALSGRPVRQRLFDPAHEAAMGHIELARWAELLLVAPATADFMARQACGMADDLLSTLVLASENPVALAPAMNQAMWRNPATQDNLDRLRQRKVAIWGPEEGGQACGDQGPGRMSEPAELLRRVIDHFSSDRLSGTEVLITAGPTREAIDPVRFLSNRSSGKMGYALAAAFYRQGASVTLISGPVALSTPGGVRRIDVESALQMEAAVQAEAPGCAIFVGCAAVADYRPQQVAGQKIKKQQPELQLQMVRNPDLLAGVAALPRPPFTVGFAAETEHAEQYAEQKRKTKGVEMIAANLVGAESGGFECDENALIVLWEGGRRELPMMDKSDLAEALVELIAERYEQKNRT